MLCNTTCIELTESVIYDVLYFVKSTTLASVQTEAHSYKSYLSWYILYVFLEGDNEYDSPEVK
jgi:hypothetical protein